MKSPMSSDGKIKVVRVIARLNIGGPAIHVVNLNAGLDPARFDQVLVCGTENPGEGSMLDYARSRGVKPVIIPDIVGQARFGLLEVKALVELYRLIRTERPHIVHTHTAKAGFLGRLAARLANVPVIVHTYHGHILHGYFGPFTTGLLRRMEAALANFTDRLITVSEQVRQEILAYGIGRADTISVIPLGFDLEPFLHCRSLHGAFRRELGFADDIQLVGIVGRIFPIKNHRLFLDAALHIAAAAPNVRFVVVGDGVLRPAMEHHARDLGLADQVVFTGWRHDLPGIYADLNVLVVSSDNEGTPVSAIEAMASGRPVVATRVGGLPDIIIEGETGYLVPPRDPRAMATAVLRLLRDPQTANRMGQTARAMAQERFPVKRLLTDTENLYDRLLDEKGVTISRL